MMGANGYLRLVKRRLDYLRERTQEDKASGRKQGHYHSEKWAIRWVVCKLFLSSVDSDEELSLTIQNLFPVGKWMRELERYRGEKKEAEKADRLEEIDRAKAATVSKANKIILERKI